MKYQCLIDGRAFGNPIRSSWLDAAADAVRSGHATWTGVDQIKRDDAVEIVSLEDWRGPAPRVMAASMAAATIKRERTCWQCWLAVLPAGGLVMEGLSAIFLGDVDWTFAIGCAAALVALGVWRRL